jgi:hypothetical protein
MRSEVHWALLATFGADILRQLGEELVTDQCIHGVKISGALNLVELLRANSGCAPNGEADAKCGHKHHKQEKLRNHFFIECVAHESVGTKYDAQRSRSGALRGFIAQRPLHRRVGPHDLLTLTSDAWAERGSHKIADHRKKDEQERERCTKREGCTPEPKGVFRMEPTNV